MSKTKTTVTKPASSIHLGVKISPELDKQIKEIRKEAAKASPGMTVSRSDIARTLLISGVAAWERREQGVVAVEVRS